MSVGSFQRRRRSSRRLLKVRKAQVLRTLTSPGACSVRRSNMNCFFLHVMYCVFTCRVLLIDGDRLCGSTLAYIILVSCIIFMTRIAMRS
jgi:hypothetical protein